MTEPTAPRVTAVVKVARDLTAIVDLSEHLETQEPSPGAQNRPLGAEQDGGGPTGHRDDTTAQRGDSVTAVRCLVCSSPLPPRPPGPGRPRKVCRDEDSPTPGGCARWRHIELRHKAYAPRPGVRRHSRPSPFDWFPDGRFVIE